MKVFNLGETEIIYKGKPIPPNGGSIDVEMNFVPDRDLKNKSLAFGYLPQGWMPKASAPAGKVIEAVASRVDRVFAVMDADLKASEPILTLEEVKVEVLKAEAALKAEAPKSDWKKNRR